MALQIGDANATTGMTQAIYSQLDATLLTDAEKNAMKPADLAAIRKGWKNLAYALSKALVTYLRDNAEISGVTTTASPTLTVTDGFGNMIGSATGTVSGTQTGIGDLS